MRTIALVTFLAAVPAFAQEPRPLICTAGAGQVLVARGGELRTAQAAAVWSSGGPPIVALACEPGQAVLALAPARRAAARAVVLRFAAGQWQVRHDVAVEDTPVAAALGGDRLVVATTGRRRAGLLFGNVGSTGRGTARALSGAPGAIAISDDGAVLLVGVGSEIRTFDLATAATGQMYSFLAAVTSFAACKGVPWWLVGDGARVVAVDPRDRPLRGVLPIRAEAQFTTPVRSAAWLDGGRFAAVTLDSSSELVLLHGPTLAVAARFPLERAPAGFVPLGPGRIAWVDEAGTVAELAVPEGVFDQAPEPVFEPLAVPEPAPAETAPVTGAAKAAPGEPAPVPAAAGAVTVASPATSVPMTAPPAPASPPVPSPQSEVPASASPASAGSPGPASPGRTDAPPPRPALVAEPAPVAAAAGAVTVAPPPTPGPATAPPAPAPPAPASPPASPPVPSPPVPSPPSASPAAASPVRTEPPSPRPALVVEPGSIVGELRGRTELVAEIVIVGPDSIVAVAAVVKPDRGTFRAAGLRPGRYRVTLTGARGASLRTQPAFATVVVSAGEGARADFDVVGAW